MNRDTVLAAGLALLALLALGVAAATLDDPTAADGDGFGFGSGSGGVAVSDETEEAESGAPIEFPSVSDGRVVGICLSWLKTPWAMAGLFLLVAAPAAYVSYRTRWLLPGIAVVVSLGGPLLLVWLALTSCRTGEFGIDLPDVSLGAGFGGNGGGGASNGAAEVAASQPSLVLGLLLVLAIAAAVLLLFTATGDLDEPVSDPEPPEAESETDVEAVGQVAGDAADRIDAEPQADVGNEVYRAWVKMTDHLAVDHPESSTPAEFATAAVDAGMEAEDVDELTALFEEVRYGDEAPTDTRVERARAALRRIESTYAAEADRGGL